MKEIIVLFGFLVSMFLELSAQNDRIRIDYLPEKPKIDGILDNGLDKLLLRKLNYYNSYNFASQEFYTTENYPKVNYRIGYNLHFFYIFIEVDFDSIYYCPKNSWKGDFMQVIFAQPNAGNLADYFYGLCFTAFKDTSERFSINYNRYDKVWNYGKNTKFAMQKHNDKLGYEVIIEWSDIKPYHPYFMNSIGFNVVFSKMINDSAMMDYFIEPSEHLNGGNGMSVNYTNVDFEKPKKCKENYYSYACYTNYFQNRPIVIDFVSSLANNMHDTIVMNIKNADDSLVFTQSLCTFLRKSITKSKVEIQPNLITGRYNLEIKSILNPIITNNILNIIPNIEFENIGSNIIQNTNNFNEGTLNSMLFQYRELNKIFVNCTNYTPCDNLNENVRSFYNAYNKFASGVNPFETPGTTQRRAYISSTDNSFQPYAIRLPYDYDKSKKYPLVIFLHGSGGDETQLDYLKSNHKYIEMAPNGRDKNKCYTTTVSQNDILESMADVIENYSVDTTNIIIGGLSMGGYGALFTCYNNPAKFNGIFLYSSITSARMGASYELYPDFTKTEYLNNFKDKPIYIHHGKQDYNAPYNMTEKMKTGLDKADAKVTFISIDNLGHGMYGDVEYYKSFFEWLESITN